MAATDRQSLPNVEEPPPGLLPKLEKLTNESIRKALKIPTNRRKRILALVRAILLRAKDEWEWVEKVPKVRLFKETNSREGSLTPVQAKLLLKQSNVVKLEWSQVNLELHHAGCEDRSQRTGT